jgi:hypothetical protein
MKNMYKSLISSVFVFCIIFFNSCDDIPKTDEQLYDKFIFTEDKNKPKIKPGDKVTVYYCLKNGDKVIMSSDMSDQDAVITIPSVNELSKFERPLLWLGLGDSCVVHIDADNAVAELLSYSEHFNKGDKATFIYKVLKID